LASRDQMTAGFVSSSMASETAFEYTSVFARADDAAILPPVITMDERGLRDIQALNAREKQNRFDIFDIFKTDGSPLTGSKWLEATGVQHSLVMKDGKPQYQYFVRTYQGDQGDPIQILTSDKAPDQAEPLIRNWRDEKMTKMEQLFKISISRDGTTETVKDIAPNPFAVRSPEVYELLALEKAFFSGQPHSINTHNGKPLSIVFPEKVSTTIADAYFEKEGSKTGAPMIVFEPTERTFSRFYEVALHELAHNEYYLMLNRAPETQNQLLRELGWQPARNAPAWLIQGRDGYLYASDFPNRQFLRVNDQGQLLDASGNRLVDRSKQVAIGYFEMKEFAREHPATDYFPSEREMAAEALSQFRATDLTRARFYQNDISQYAAVKAYDQFVIDNAYGRKSDGTSQFIRLPGGLLAENNFGNQMTVFRYEESLKNGTYQPGVEPLPPARQPLPFVCQWC
jgi:hypothetical protein